MAESLGETPKAEQADLTEIKKPQTLFKRAGTNLYRNGKTAVLAAFLGAVIIACEDSEAKNTGFSQEPNTPGVEKTIREQPTQTESPVEAKNFDLVFEDPAQSENLQYFSQMVEEEMKKFPKVGKVKIKVYEPNEEDRKSQNYFYYTEESGPVILMNRAMINPDTSGQDLVHELGHYFNPQANKSYWQEFYTLDQLNAIQAVYHNAVTDSEWGVPENEDLFLMFFQEEMKLAKDYPQTESKAEVLQTSAKRYALGYMLSGRTSPEDTSENAFDPILESATQDIKNKAANNPELLESAPYLSVAEALSDPVQQEILSDIADKYPVVKIGLEELEKHKDLLTTEKLRMLELSPSRVKVEGVKKINWTNSIVNVLVEGEIRNAYTTNNTEVINSLPQEVREILAKETTDTRTLALSEAFSEQLKVSESSPAWEVIRAFREAR